MCLMVPISANNHILLHFYLSVLFCVCEICHHDRSLCSVYQNLIETESSVHWEFSKSENKGKVENV